MFKKRKAEVVEPPLQTTDLDLWSLDKTANYGEILKEEIAADLTAGSGEAVEAEPTAVSRGFNHKWYIWGPIIAFVLTFCGAYLIFGLVLAKNVAEAPVVAVPQVTTPTSVVGEYTVVCRDICYDLCGHIVSENLKGDLEFLGKSYDRLVAEGWQVVELGPSKLGVSRHQVGICPDDMKKRVVKQTERGLAVYYGTIAATGDLIMEMPIILSELPEKWQADLQAGGVEFHSEARLFEVMESFDELIVGDEI